jgi:hypothetical protein
MTSGEPTQRRQPANNRPPQPTPQWPENVASHPERDSTLFRNYPKKGRIGVCLTKWNQLLTNRI